MIQWKRVLEILLLAILATISGCGGPADESEEAPSGEPAAVRAVPAAAMTLYPSMDLVGILAAMPEHTVVLSTQVGGQVERVCVTESQEIHAGDEIIVLDDRAVKAALAKSIAALAEARSALALLRKGAHPRAIEAARQDMARAEAAERSTRQKFDALAPLHAKREVSDVRYEQANAEMAAAHAEKKAAEARLKLLEAGARPEEIAESEAKAASAGAEVTARELAVNLSTIRSPIDGIVTKLPVRQGMYVAPPAALATIMDLTTLFAQVRIPAPYLARVRIGAGVTGNVPSLPEVKLIGSITRIAKEANAQTGDVTAFAAVSNPTGGLRPGLACRLQVALPEVLDAVVVPISAISDHDGVPIVTLIRDGKAYETEVQLGSRIPDFAQIIEGVIPGNLVAIEGGYGLPQGCPVRVVKGAEDAEQ